MWVVYALLSAVFASFTAIFAKIGIENVNSNLATAIRTVVVLVLAWGIVFLTGAQKGISEISSKSLKFLVLSGACTGFSWLFYFLAIKMGNVSKVAPIDKFSIVLTVILSVIILGEKLDPKTIVAVGFITVGTFIMILK